MQLQEVEVKKIIWLLVLSIIYFFVVIVLLIPLTKYFFQESWLIPSAIGVGILFGFLYALYKRYLK